ncbi:MAG: hypothetical protein QOE68_2897 [Thermoanaerobaculia bacterium]|nr:hypothetical protein [Thermoanaerobaculia bacterium]
MKSLSFLLLFIATSAFAGSPSTVNNDDSCDVTVGPAATLLLPYFEVDFNNRVQNTLFTITNVTRLPQIAHVTIWTDWSYPLLGFNIYLTGYDVQGISINQILGGVVAQNNGTGPTTAQSPLGALSAGFTANPNFASGGASINCSAQPGALTPALVAALRTALSTGVYNPSGSAVCPNAVGGVHESANGYANAIGYITIDVVSNCTSRLPTDPLYYTNDLLFDNVLIGDYQQLGPTPAGTTASSFDAVVNPLVHIRAVPEGGGAGSKAGTALQYTFYDRYTPASSRAIDRRQPLPSTFAARFVQGGTAAYRTNLNIWREGVGNGSCPDAQTSTMAVAEIVRFDEHENPSTLGSDSLVSHPRLPATSSTSSSSPSYPATVSSDAGGWFYLNLNNGGSTTYSANHNGLAPVGSTTTAGPRPSQNWVTVTMFGSQGGGNRLTAEFDASALGNGCSPAAFPSSAAPIGPADGVFLCPPGTTLTNGSTAQCMDSAVIALPLTTAAERTRAVRTTTPPASTRNDDSCDVKPAPAATLLLPYFEVDVAGTSGQTTLFTVTNVAQYPQIAHVTLWTDYAYPVMSFNLFLGGYAVQSINLADVLIRNTIASSTGITPGSIWPAANPNLRSSIDCATIPGAVPAAIMAEVRRALTAGTSASSCNRPVGGVHANAIGYATIDLVASCTSRSPNDPLYYTNDLLFDNVLIGDYQQLGPHPGGTATSFDAGGNPMVHLRAVPEGGGAGSNVGTRLPYTFYDRYTPAKTRTIDRRQPLPSTFAARYIQGGTGAFATNLTIWREGFGTGSCADAFTSANMLVSEIIKFDEHENPNTIPPCTSLCLGVSPALLSAASSITISESRNYPLYLSTADVGGWIYLNLNNGGSTSYSVTQESGGERLPTNARSNLAPIGSGTVGPRPSQNWVTITLFGFAGGNRLTGEFDATPLGNGCSPAVAVGPFIGPAGGVPVCPPGTTLTNGSTQLCKGTNVNPPP